MKKVVINEYFKDEYLTCGKTRDNFIFENCPIEFIREAKELLSNSSEEVKSGVIKITRKQEEKIEETLSQFEHDIQKSLIARDYVCSLIMLEILKGKTNNSGEIKFLKQGISAISNGDYWKAREFSINSPNPWDISREAKNRKIELNILLIDTKNKYLQRAINNLVSSREPYSIKIFASQTLPSYLDEIGNRIECPHDYMRLNINNYVQVINELNN